MLEVLVPGGGTTFHLPFPHPIMVGAGRSLVVQGGIPGGGLEPVTVVGYEWIPSDDRPTIFSPFKFLISKRDPSVYTR
jgi:hypothetical protein